MREQYPTRDGIAVSPFELNLPDTRRPDKRKYRSNHHTHYTAPRFSKSSTLQAMRNLSRHQVILPNDVHRFIHDNYEPPELPSEPQAAKEIIDAYENGELFKIYNTFLKTYIYEEIPKEIVDGLIAKYSLGRFISVAAD